VRSLPAVVAGVALLLGGCTAATPTPAPSATSVPPTATPALDAATTAFLARHGLDGLTPQEIVESLDAAAEDREQGPFGSVRPSELLLGDDEEEVVVPLPADSFYLAFAPYREQTHDCYNHNLATCQGELSEQVVAVTVVDGSGATLVDQELTTHTNGFAGIWLPSNITGTLTVSQGGDTATTPIATGADDPTCLTTLKLG